MPNALFGGSDTDLNDCRQEVEQKVYVAAQRTENQRDCGKCGLRKPLEAFVKHKRSHLGRRRVCKSCIALYKAAYRARNLDKELAQGRAAYLRHAEKRRAYSRQWYAENKPHQAAYAAAYRVKHLDRLRANGARWYEANRPRLKALRTLNREWRYHLGRLWRAANPEASRIRSRNRRARLKSAEGTHTKFEIRRLLVAQRGKCASPKCRIRLRTKYHADHIVPLAKGGSNWIKNIQLLCPRCNREKYDLDPISWANRLGLLI